jgi:hypothetical protein
MGGRMIKKIIALIVIFWVGVGAINELEAKIWLLKLFKFSENQIEYIMRELE